MINNKLQNITHKTKYPVTRIPLNIRGDFRCSRRVCCPAPLDNLSCYQFIVDIRNNAVLHIYLIPYHHLPRLNILFSSCCNKTVCCWSFKDVDFSLISSNFVLSERVCFEIKWNIDLLKHIQHRNVVKINKELIIGQHNKPKWWATWAMSRQ